MMRTIGALALLTAGSGSLAADTRVHALATLRPGLWSLQSIDRSEGRRTLCVANPAQLVQLKHPGQHCAARLLVNDEKRATVQYRCPTTGYGRTTIGVEGPALATIDTQGLADGAPFDVSYEARWRGPCGGR